MEILKKYFISVHVSYTMNRVTYNPHVFRRSPATSAFVGYSNHIICLLKNTTGMGYQLQQTISDSSIAMRNTVACQTEFNIDTILDFVSRFFQSVCYKFAVSSQNMIVALVPITMPSRKIT